MKALITVFAGTVLFLFAFSNSVSGNGQVLTTNLISQLSARTHETWEGTYTFLESSVLRIDGLRDLHLITYRSEGREGMLLDFAVVDDNGKIRFLQEAQENVKGVTPVLQGVDVFVSAQAVELIVRWRHPGNGGLRTVEKYTYNSTNLRLVGRTDFLGKDGGFKWVNSSEITSAKSVPSTVRRATRRLGSGLHNTY